MKRIFSFLLSSLRTLNSIEVGYESIIRNSLKLICFSMIFIESLEEY